MLDLGYLGILAGNLCSICNWLFYLKYIQEHEQQYPRIFQLAMDMIPIQASSVPCERVFSSGEGDNGTSEKMYHS